MPFRSKFLMLSFRTDRSGQTMQTQIRQLLEEQSDQDSVYIVCHSVCIFWTHYSVLKRYCSTFRIFTSFSGVWIFRNFTVTPIPSRKLLRIKVTPDLHPTYSKNGGNLGLVLKMKNIACISILLTKHVKYTYLYLFKFVLYSIVAFKAN